MKILETERLMLREFTADDSEFIIKLFNSPGWLQFIGDRGIKTTDAAKKYIAEKYLHSYEINGFGIYMTLIKNNNIPIGMCGLVKRETLVDVDIGFAFLQEFTGRGYAFEAASATLNYAASKLKLQRIVAITTENNLNSIKLLKKLKMKFEKKIMMAGDEEELMLFSNS